MKQVGVMTFSSEISQTSESMALNLELPDPKLKGTKPEIAACRISFLFGSGDGPIQNTKTLAELHGIAEKTVRKWIPTWLKESEERVTNGNGRSSSLSLSDETTTSHRNDIDFIRNEMDDIKIEMTNLSAVIKKLEDFLEKFEHDDQDFLIKSFQFYLNAHCNKVSLQKRFLALQSQWTKMAGLDAMMDIQVAGAKTVAVIQAKKAAVSEELENPVSTETGITFKRRV